MTCIGKFTATTDGFEGRLHTLTTDIELVIVPAEPSDAGKAPDYRILAGGGDQNYEVGAGWKRVGDKAGDYIAILIDDPAFARPLRANLFQSDPGAYVLLWSRPLRRAGAD